MTENVNHNATPSTAGTLSLDYLSPLLQGYAGLGARYAITSQVQWGRFDTELEPSATTTNLEGSLADAADSARRGFPLGRGTISVVRRGAKTTMAGKPSSDLSEREKSCLSWTALGKSSWEIGRILYISENTVIFHIKNAMRKFGVSSRTLAALRAVQLGLIEPIVGVEPQIRSRVR
jgi:DNA-binding CsgD family transcriptional regulator